MCDNCRVATAQMLVAILGGCAAPLDEINEKIARQLRRDPEHPYSEQELQALHFTKDGVLLCAKMGAIYTDPDLGQQERMDNLEALLISDPSERVPVEVLVTGAKFAHYASTLLRDLAGTIARSIDVRAAEEYDRTAIDFAFGDVAEEIRDAREPSAPKPTIGAIPVPRALVEQLRRASGSGGKPGKPSPDFRH